MKARLMLGVAIVFSTGCANDLPTTPIHVSTHAPNLSIGGAQQNGAGIWYPSNFGEQQTSMSSLIDFSISEGEPSPRYGSFWLRGSYAGHYPSSFIYFSAPVRNVHITTSGNVAVSGVFARSGYNGAPAFFLGLDRFTKWDFTQGVLLQSNITSMQIQTHYAHDFSNISFVVESTGEQCAVEPPAISTPLASSVDAIVPTDCGVTVTFPRGYLKDRMNSVNVAGSTVRPGYVPGSTGRIVIDFPGQKPKSFTTSVMSRGNGYVLGLDSDGQIVASGEYNQDASSSFTISPVRIRTGSGQFISRVVIAGSGLVAANNLAWTP